MLIRVKVIRVLVIRVRDIILSLISYQHILIIFIRISIQLLHHQLIDFIIIDNDNNGG
jgi:hypothetical protein